MSWLSYKAAGLYASVSTRTVRNWVREGRLKVYRVAGVHRIKSSEIDQLFENGQQCSDLEKFEKEIDQMVGEMR